MNVFKKDNPIASELLDDLLEDDFTSVSCSEDVGSICLDLPDLSVETHIEGTQESVPPAAFVDESDALTVVEGGSEKGVASVEGSMDLDSGESARDGELSLDGDLTSSGATLVDGEVGPLPSEPTVVISEQELTEGLWGAPTESEEITTLGLSEPTAVVDEGARPAPVASESVILEKEDESSDLTGVGPISESLEGEGVVSHLGEVGELSSEASAEEPLRVEPNGSEQQSAEPPRGERDVTRTVPMKKEEIFLRDHLGALSGVLPSSATEVSLSQSEALRISQEKILELENEIERLREENESLAAAGQALTGRADELIAQLEQVEFQKHQSVERWDQERKTLLDAMKVKDKELEASKRREDEFEVRLSSNLKKIRVRERELENRLELARLEGAALIRNKDEIILDMKRQLDQSAHEIQGYRSKGQELSHKISDHQETLRGAVRALRMALSLLEGEDLDSGEVIPHKVG